MIRILAGLLLAGTAAFAQARGTPGQFDYWVLALSWSPQHCADHADAQQCVRPYDFVVHGLWPQHERGYPEHCGRSEPLDRELAQRMSFMMPGERQAEYQWRKHGSCSGLPPREYFMTVERARRAIAVPAAYELPEKPVATTAEALRGEFVRANPGLAPAAIALQCRGRYLKEVRICLDKQFQFRACSEDLEDRCGESVVLRGVRGLGR